MAIQTGITHLDTAEVYNNEASVGRGIVASGVPRSSLFVTTKLFRLAPVPSGSAAEGVKAKLQQELHDLQLDYVDFYLWHTPVGHEGNIAEVWKGFELVKKEGLAKHVGVSNFRVRDLEEILNSNPEILPEINQVSV
jgi:diketogulonate reductase-like aldo/keto reductase